MELIKESKSPTMIEKPTSVKPQSRWCKPGQAAHLVAIGFDRRDPYANDQSVTK